jgi:hypothetical protein
VGSEMCIRDSDETEVAVLYGLANLLCIRPEFIDQILNDAENME